MDIYQENKGTVDYLDRLFADYKERYGESSDEMLNLVYMIQQAFSEQIGERTAGKHNCKKGCYYCCQMPVEIMEVEGLILWNYAKKNFSEEHRKLILDRCRKQIHLPKESDEFIDKFTGEETACPFLEKGLCSVYQARPMACRNLLIPLCSNPADCAVRSSNRGQRYFAFGQYASTMISLIKNSTSQAEKELRVSSRIYDVILRVAEGGKNI